MIRCWVSAILWLVSKNITTLLILYTGWPELKMSVTAPPATETFHLLFRYCPKEHDIISHQWVFTTWISHKYALIYLFLAVVRCVMRAAPLCGETIKYKSSCSETVNPVLGWNVVMSVSWYLVMLIPASSAFQTQLGPAWRLFLPSIPSFLTFKLCSGSLVSWMQCRIYLRWYIIQLINTI